MQTLKKTHVLPALALLLSLAIVGSVQAAGGMGRVLHSPLMTRSQVELGMNMRKLWEDHITWTRVYIIAALAEAPDASSAANRLLQNQEDIGDAFGQYYGQPVGDELTGLLTEHITTAVDVIAAARDGDAAALAEANERWYANAEDLAVFLNSVNPNWPVDDLRTMLNKHLELTTMEVTTRLAGDYPADVDAYDAVHDEALMMADAFTMGIIQQFPGTFARTQ